MGVTPMATMMIEIAQPHKQESAYVPFSFFLPFLSTRVTLHKARDAVHNNQKIKQTRRKGRGLSVHPQECSGVFSLLIRD